MMRHLRAALIQVIIAEPAAKRNGAFPHGAEIG